MTDEQVEIVAKTISDGHAFIKHTAEFGGLSRDAFRAKIARTLSKPAIVLKLTEERTVFWSDEEQMVVIINPKDAEGGTAFRPKAGRDYLDSLE